MEPTDLASRVTDLRTRGLTPKEIARTLGVRRAEVDRLIRAHAVLARPGEAALCGCWVSPGWSTGLTWDGHADWRDDFRNDDGEHLPPLVNVLVVREHRYGKVSACGYLVDPHCLGVKDVIGPRVMERHELREFVGHFFRGYDEEPHAVAIDLAQNLVLGAVEYARRLGFEPHPDFAACRGQLGAWSGPGAIEFGYRGKPYFIQGPRDDTAAILRTLERSVGRGKFKYVTLEDLR